MSKGRNITIDIAKGIAIILVVVGHVTQFGTVGEGYWNDTLFKTIYTFHMPFFMLLSGYVSIKGISNRSFVDTAKKRFSTLIIPFLSWAIIMYAYLILANAVIGLNSGVETNILYYVVSVVLSPGKGLWFLWVLFFLNILLALIIKFVPKFGMIVSIILYAIVLKIPCSDLFYVYMIKWLYPFFFIGAYSYVYKQQLSKLIKPIIILFSILFPILILWWGKSDYVYISKMEFNGGTLNNIGDFLYRYLIAFAGISLALLISKLVMKSRQTTELLNKVGRYTIDIYAIETIFIPLLPHLPHLKGALFYLVYVPIVSLAIIIMSYLISKFIIRKIPILNRLLLGGR